MDAILDKFFFIFHGSVILFNLFGWIWRRTRKANLALLTITAFSWLVLGIWKGFGYCFLVDWHWAVRERLGDRDLPSSYIKFLLDRMTGLSFDPGFVDSVTAWVFAVAFSASLILNLRDWKNRWD